MGAIFTQKERSGAARPRPAKSTAALQFVLSVLHILLCICMKILAHFLLNITPNLLSRLSLIRENVAERREQRFSSAAASLPTAVATIKQIMITMMMT